MKLLLAEDEKRMNRTLCELLRREGYEVTGVEDGEDALYELESGVYDLCVLDVMMPKMNGYTVAKRARAAGIRTPVLMLTAKSELDDKVEGLDSGADDYLAKPFGMLELISRIKALLRRTSDTAAESGKLELGGLCIYPSKHEVFAEGEKVALTLKEYDMLLFLVKNRGEVYSRDCLLKEIWGYDFSGESRTVDVHIRTLRQKLGGCGELIQTIRGVGYKAGDDVSD